jgi:hypothetical protein
MQDCEKIISHQQLNELTFFKYKWINYLFRKGRDKTRIQQSAISWFFFSYHRMQQNLWATYYRVGFPLENISLFRACTNVGFSSQAFNTLFADIEALKYNVILFGRGSEPWKSEHWRVRTSKVFLGWSEGQKSLHQKHDQKSLCQKHDWMSV